MAQRLRIFISSPADVPDERLRADLIVDKLSQDYSRFFTIESYRWEHEAMLASKHFQDAIEPPSAFDIVVLILWSRLGTPLPEKTAEREYRGIDGRAPVTGTEWEYEEALKAAREKQAPDLLAFRNVSPTPIDTRDAEARARSNAQLDALDAFWRRHFVNRGVFLAAYDEYRTVEEFASRLEETLRKLIERRIKDMSADKAGTEPTWLGEPFRGLEPYEFEHAPIFFGRDAAVIKATEQLAVNARSGRAFLLVSGASGTGKSSLVKAGMVPRLMKPQRISGAAFRRRTVFRPAVGGTDVFLGLATALTRAGGQDAGLPELIAPGQDAGKLAAHLRSVVGEPGYLFANALGRVTEAERKSGRLLGFEDAKLILVVDQFEELFTVSGIGTEDRRLFVQLLAGLARSGVVWVIVTMRADFWHRAMGIPELIVLTEGQGRIDLAAASSAELAEMIRKPAQAAGLSFEVHPQTGLGLDSVLAGDAAAAPGVLPLLSFTLDELYKNAKARAASVLTYASYEALGGLEGAIANRANEIMSGLPAPAQAALPRVLRELTTVSGITDQVARSAPLARAAPLASFAEEGPARTLVDAFVAARLLVAASGEGGAAPTVRIAHEALIGRWKRARDQLAADRRDLETRTLVEQQYGRWSCARGGARWLLLLRNPDLANAVDLARRWGDELDAPLRDFIKWSVRRARLAQALTVAAALLFAVVAGVAYWQRSVSIQQRQIATANETRALAALSRGATNDNKPHDGIKLALAAWPRTGADRPELEVTLRSLALASAVGPPYRNFRHDGAVDGALLIDGGRRILSWSDDKTLRLWDAATGAQIGPAMTHEGAVNGALPIDAGRRILSWSADKTLRLWDAATGAQIGPAMTHEGAVNGALLIDGGRRILSWSADKTLRLWDAATGAQIGPPMKHDAWVFGALLIDGGRRILSWSADKTLRLWDAATGAQIGPAMTHNSLVNRALLLDVGHRILSWAADKTLRLWDAATGAQIGPAMTHDGAVLGALLLDGERRILSWSNDKTLRLWDAATGAQIGPAMTHDGAVLGALLIDGGRRILSWSDDKTLRLWDAATGAQIGPAMTHDGWVWGALLLDGGRRILSWSADDTLRLWDAATGAQIGPAMTHGDAVRGALMPVRGALLLDGGRRILSWSGDKTLRLWDGATGAQVGPAMSHGGPLYGALLLDGGRRIVSWSGDKTLRLWDAATGAQTGSVMTHDGAVLGALLLDGERRILSWSNDKTLRLWDAATGAQVGPAITHDGAVLGALLLDGGRRILSWSADKTLRLWDAATGARIGPAMTHDGAVLGALLLDGGRRILSWSADKTLRLWDAATGAQIGLPMTHADAVFGALLLDGGRRIVSWSKDKTLRLWDAATGAQIGPAMTHEGAVNGALLIDGGRRILSWSADKTLRLWDAATGAQIGPAMKHGDAVRGALLLDGERRILSWSADKTLRLWDAATGAQIGPAMTHDNLVNGALLLDGGHRILSWSLDKTLRLWDAATGAQIGPAMTHGDEVRGALLLDGGRRILSWSEDKTLRLWDASWKGDSLFEIACNHWPDHDLIPLRAQYGVAINEPICVPGKTIPLPDWSRIERAPN